MIVTGGAVDYTDAAAPVFKPCKFWNFAAMTEMFRLELIEMMSRKGVLLPEIAVNLLSWKHSGFHVHASHPFLPSERELVRTRLAYAFRPATTLAKIAFDGRTVVITTRKQSLHFTPVEFLAKLTLHIPDRYQNVRRYAGFYCVLSYVEGCLNRSVQGKGGGREGEMCGEHRNRRAGQTQVGRSYREDIRRNAAHVPQMRPCYGSQRICRLCNPDSKAFSGNSAGAA